MFRLPTTFLQLENNNLNKADNVKTEVPEGNKHSTAFHDSRKFLQETSELLLFAHHDPRCVYDLITHLVHEAQKAHKKTLQNNCTILHHTKYSYETHTDSFCFCFSSQML